MTQEWASFDRLTAAREHDRCCELCEHRCRVDRSAAASIRWPCRAGAQARVFRHRVEYSEESDLIPSHLFYLSGCDLRCAFCIAGENAFDPRKGRELTPEFFQAAVEWGCDQGARNIQWVGGEPTIHLPRILEVMAAFQGTLPPVLWKSDFHMTPQALELLDGVVDVYIADLKFGNDACARRIAGVDNYLAIVERNLKIAAKQARLIVRHLLLPGHDQCCYRPILRWLSRELPKAEFSLREGYLPMWRAPRIAELSRTIRPDEAAAAMTLAIGHELKVIQ